MLTEPRTKPVGLFCICVNLDKDEKMIRFFLYLSLEIEPYY